MRTCTTAMWGRLLAVGLSVAVLAGCGDEATGSSMTGAAPISTPIPILRQTPTPQPTPTPASAGPAVIGGTLAAFEARFGAPNDHSHPPQYHFWRCGQALDCAILETDYLDFADATLSSRVIHLVLAHPDSSKPWSRTAAEAYCRGFAPTDLRYVQTIPGVGGGAGYDVVYDSPTLAKVFPAKDFTDNNGTAVQAGSLDIEYLYAGSNPDQIESCDLVIGIQPSP